MTLFVPFQYCSFCRPIVFVAVGNIEPAVVTMRAKLGDIRATMASVVAKLCRRLRGSVSVPVHAVAGRLNLATTRCAAENEKSWENDRVFLGFRTSSRLLRAVGDGGEPGGEGVGEAGDGGFELGDVGDGDRGDHVPLDNLVQVHPLVRAQRRGWRRRPAGWRLGIRTPGARLFLRRSTRMSKSLPLPSLLLAVRTFRSFCASR
jgi:hypothetical protein